MENSTRYLHLSGSLNMRSSLSLSAPPDAEMTGARRTKANLDTLTLAQSSFSIGFNFRPFYIISLPF